MLTWTYHSNSKGLMLWPSVLRQFRTSNLDHWTSTHWGRMTHICIGNLTIIDWCQAIIWTNAGILLIGPLKTNFSEIFAEIITFSKENLFESVVCEMAAILSRPQCFNKIDCNSVGVWYSPASCDHLATFKVMYWSLKWLIYTHSNSVLIHKKNCGICIRCPFKISFPFLNKSLDS